MIKINKNIFLALFLPIISFFSAFSQLTVNTTLTGPQLVANIVGPGYTISNIKMSCPTGASGSFLANNSGIGIPSGILLTTGSATQAIGPNNNGSAGTNSGTSGDADLDSLSNIGKPPPPAPQTRTYDACAIEFDMIPACNLFSIRFMFGSEEYKEFVGSTFNDVFGFFISGLGIPNGKANLAKVPTTLENITVNTIHGLATNSYTPFTHQPKNQQFYVDNPQGGPATNLQYDGYTTAITSSITVIPCELYHMKIAIADVDDGIFESGVFIESGSIQCSPVVYSNIGTVADPTEGCNSGSFEFCRTGPNSAPLIVTYTTSGTATNGVDYVFLPGTVTIPAGQTCATVSLTPIFDPIVEGCETVIVHFVHGSCPGTDSIVMHICDPPPFDAGPDKLICSDGSVQIGVNPLSGYGYTWTPTTGLSNPNIANPIVTRINNGNTPLIITYSVSVLSSGNCILGDTMRLTVRPAPIATFSVQGACTQQPTSITDLSMGTGGAIVNKWYWDLGGSLYDIVQNPKPVYNNSGTYAIKLTATDNFGCTDDTTISIVIDPLPIPDFNTVNPCVGDSASFVNISTVPGGTIGQSIWNFPPLVNSNDPVVKHFYPSSGKYNVQLIVTSDKNCVNTITKEIEVYEKPTVIFTGDPACVNTPSRFYNTSTADYFKWHFGDGDSSSVRNPKHTYDSPGEKTIRLVGTSRYGCKDSTTNTVTVYPQPIADFTLDSVSGCAPLCVNFQDNTTINALDSIDSWQWIFDTGTLIGSGNQTHCFNNSGVFSPGLIVSSTGGCTDTVFKSATITVYQQPIAAFDISPSITTIYDATINFSDRSGEIVVSWDFGDTTAKDLSGSPSLQHTYLEPGSYTVTQIVRNAAGCLDTTIGVLRIDPETTVFVPNAFTPNDDGHNETFFPKVSGYLLDANFEMYIYDRWGNMVFTSNLLGNEWNGKANGGKELAQQDVFNYIIIFKDKFNDQELKRLTGHVTLVR